MGSGGKGGSDGPDLGLLMDVEGLQKGIAVDVWNRSQPLAKQVFGDLGCNCQGLWMSTPTCNDCWQQ